MEGEEWKEFYKVMAAGFFCIPYEEVTEEHEVRYKEATFQPDYWKAKAADYFKVHYADVTEEQRLAMVEARQQEEDESRVYVSVPEPFQTSFQFLRRTTTTIVASHKEKNDKVP